jgi:uncharacterized protein YbjT (DUF2867 family)
VIGNTSQGDVGRRPQDMENNGTVLVTGAGGQLGRVVVPRLAQAGHNVRPMSRSPRPGWVLADLETGAGLDEAVRGVTTIVHLASAPRRSQQTDVEGTRRLLAAARTAGVRHVLYISINGVDRVPLAYYRAKLATETVVEQGGVPWTVLRAAQFPSLVDTMVGVSARLGPVILDPRWVAQPVAVEDVRARCTSTSWPVPGSRLGAGPARSGGSGSRVARRPRSGPVD